MSRRPTGLKKCRRCGERHPFPSEFNVTRNGTPSMYCKHCPPRYRWCKGCGKRCRVPDELGPRGRKCRECKRRTKYLSDQKYYARHRERIIARANAWNHAHPERHREHLRKAWETMRADQERYATYLINKRIDHRLNGYTIGVQHKVNGTTDPWEAAPKGQAHGPQYDAEPLSNWLRREFPGWTHRDLAIWLDEDDSQIGRLLRGEQQHISLHVADRIFVKADCTHLLALLYPGESTS